MDLFMLRYIGFTTISLASTVILIIAACLIFRDGHIELNVGTVSLLINIMEKLVLASLALAGSQVTVRAVWRKTTTRGGLLQLSEAVRSVQGGVMSSALALLDTTYSVRISLILAVYTVLGLTVVASGVGLSKGLGAMYVPDVCSRETARTFTMPNCDDLIDMCGLNSGAKGALFPTGTIRTTQIVQNGTDNNITVLGKSGYAVAAHIGTHVLNSASTVNVTNLNAIVAQASCTVNVSRSAVVADPSKQPYLKFTISNGKSYQVWDLQGLTMLDLNHPSNTLQFALVASNDSMDDSIVYHPDSVSKQPSWLKTTVSTFRGNSAALFKCTISVGSARINILQSNGTYHSSVRDINWKVKNLQWNKSQTSKALEIQAQGFNFNALTLANGNRNPAVDPHVYDGRTLPGLELDLAKYIAASAIVTVDTSLSYLKQHGIPYGMTSNLARLTFGVTRCNIKMVTTVAYWPFVFVWMGVCAMCALTIATIGTMEQFGHRYTDSQSKVVTKNMLVWQSLSSSWGLARLLLHDRGDWCADSRMMFIGKQNLIQEKIGIVRWRNGLFWHFGLIGLEVPDEEVVGGPSRLR